MAHCPSCGALIEGARCRFCAGKNREPLPAPPPPVFAAPPSIFPGKLETIAGAAAPSPIGPSHDHSSTPRELTEFAKEMEEWALANERDVRKDTFRFWMLKIPAIITSASSGLVALFHLEVVAAVLAAITSVCVLIDAINPGGQLRNAHLKAVHDLRDLQHQVMNDWRIGTLEGRPAGRLAAQILTNAEKVRDKIAKELRTAETTFSVKSKR